MKRLVWITIFGITMAYLESAIVVYLRELYYPSGFSFPIIQIPLKISLIEIGREAATVVMLYAIAWLAFRKAILRFCAFIFTFGVWDIFYYIWLYVMIGWPPSPLTWDILYLIPLPWIGPVIAPVIVSISMIASSLSIIHLNERGIEFRTKLWQWLVIIAAGLIIILSFIIDYRVVIDGTMPGKFKWGIFFIGESLGIAVFINALWNNLKAKTK